MAAAGSSSSQQDSALLNTHFCLNDIDKGNVSFAKTSNSHVDISGICSSITAKNLKSFLQTLHHVYKSPSNEKTILQLVSNALVDENKCDLKDEFLQNILRLIEDCFVRAEDEKHPQKKAIRLENEFCEKRFFSTFGLRTPYDDIRVITVENDEKSAEESVTDCDDSEFASIKNHAGWVIKRARETISKGESDSLKVMETEGGPSVVCGEKHKALELISTLGKDFKQADGKFRFIVYEHIVPLFLFLHNLIESIITPNIALQKGKILINGLEKLAANKVLREKWKDLTSLRSNATSVVVLQRIVTFFLKSKQQMIREKMRA
ncbi:Hypothetical predicted protein [Paramuricea clavata]|uniref:Uncharacterized protein n=1 Tax=Paramuricea clavata TaxID=317549 RepID=A0A6S7KLA4_PARCT|nr:Hypothetical predicted protein [Paramuricea clavata]